MELIYGGTLSGVSYNWFGWPILNSDLDRENYKKYQDKQKRIVEYEKQRDEKRTLLRRLRCILMFSHTDELIGAFDSDGVSTRIKDCTYCGRRKIKYYQ